MQTRKADYLDESGAYKLAATIRAYWAARFQHPRVWVEKITSVQSAEAAIREIFVVKSDMKGGMPA